MSLQGTSLETVGMMVSTFDEGVERSDDNPDELLDVVGDAPEILAMVALEILSPEGLTLMIQHLRRAGADV